jgi:hypothetical protein
MALSRTIGLEPVQVGVRQGAGGAHAGVVHQHGDGRVRPQPRLHPAEVGGVGEVGRQDLYAPAGVPRQLSGQCLQLGTVPGDEDQVVAAPRQAVRVDGADAGGGAGDQGCPGRAVVLHIRAPLHSVVPTGRAQAASG